MRRRLALALITAAFPLAAGAQTKSPLLHVGGSADNDAAPILYGIESGIFRRNGLEVAFQKAASGSAVAAAVAGGALEIGKASMVPLISAHARNVPLTIIAPSVVHRVGIADSALLVAVDSPFHVARDLNGKAISTAGLNDMQWLASHAWLDANGGDSLSMRYLEIPGSSVAIALEQGRISAGTLSEPYITQALKAGKGRIFGKMVDIFGHAMTAGYFTTLDFATKNRDAIARFNHAIVEASAFCNTHPAEITDLMAGLTGIERATLVEMIRPEFALDLDPHAIQPIVNAAAKYKVIAQPFDAQELYFR